MNSHTSTVMRVLAAIFGTLPVALLANACIARFAPFTADSRFALAYAAVIPTWLLGMCCAFLAHSALRSWIVCLAASALLAGIVFGIPH